MIKKIDILNKNYRMQTKKNEFLSKLIFRKGGAIGMFISLVPKVLQSWGLFNFDKLVHLVEFPNVSTTNCNLQNE